MTSFAPPPRCRRELPVDLEAIRAVVTAAFGQTNEARLVDALRSASALVLSAVAEVDGRVVGHISFSPVKIENEHGSCEALALAPMAVLPEWQRRGVGSALIRWSLDECRRDGHKLVIVVGHPEYYPRFGFVPAKPLGVGCPFEVPDEVFMLAELHPRALGGRTGVVRYRPEFASV